MHKVQSPNTQGLDPIMRARSGDVPAVRHDGSIGIPARNTLENSSNYILKTKKSDSSLESIGVFEGFPNKLSNVNNSPIAVDSNRPSTIIGSSTFDDNASSTSEKRKVRWGPTTKAPHQGCGVNSSDVIQLADFYQSIGELSSTIGKAAKQFGERIKVMGVKCTSEGSIIREECDNAFDITCGDLLNGTSTAECHSSKEEYNSLIHSSRHFGNGTSEKWGTNPITRDFIQESRDALDSYDKMRESRQCDSEPPNAVKEDTILTNQGDLSSRHFTFDDNNWDRTNRSARRKAHVSHFGSPSSNRSSGNKIETGIGGSVNVMSPTFYRSPRTYGLNSPNCNAMKSPVSILKKNHGRYATSGCSAFPTTTGDARVKLVKHGHNISHNSDKQSTKTMSPTSRMKKSNGRRVLGGLVKKSLKFMSHGTRSQVKKSYPTPVLAIGAQPSPSHKHC